MSRIKTKRILYRDGTFKYWIAPAEFERKRLLRLLWAVYEERDGAPHCIGWTDDRTPKSTAVETRTTEATVTVADSLARFGLSRFKNGVISRGRQIQANIKIMSEGPLQSYRLAENKFIGPELVPVNRKASV